MPYDLKRISAKFGFDYTQSAQANRELQQEFAQRLANDRNFAGDPSARLEFFHRRHESWDERYNLYPVFRLDRK
jgi:hypothetical protein